MTWRQHIFHYDHVLLYCVSLHGTSLLFTLYHAFKHSQA